VADRSIVLDANIMIRAVMGQKVRAIIQRYAAEVRMVAPEAVFLEVEEHLPRLCAERGLDLEKMMALHERISALVQELPAPFYAKQEEEARARIEKLDPDDWPALACALTLACPIWTEDRHFFGAGVPTWTTDRVDRYLSNSEKPQLEEVKGSKP
jgi:predicted nucleic acid-binding protein